MTGIGHQLFALQVLCKELFAKRDRLVLIGFVQTMSEPDVLRALDNECRCLVVKLVDVRLKPSMLCLFEQEGKCVILAVGAQPDESIGTRHDVRLEDIGQAAANARIDAVTCDDQVGIGKVQI